MVGIRPQRQQSPQTNRLGTAEQLRDLSSARQMTSGLMREINPTDIRMAGTSITVAQLADHFQQQELGCSNGRISYSTEKAYQGYLGKWIVPRWGDYIPPNIKAVEVELWLKHLQRAPGTCCKIRNVMSVLFNHARRYDLYDHNPIHWVRQNGKRRSAPDVLTCKRGPATAGGARTTGANHGLARCGNGTKDKANCLTVCAQVEGRRLQE
jgi:hypothetical protein